MSSLPTPSPEAAQHSARLCEFIRRDIAEKGGWIPFARYMELALYAPGLGYYTAGAHKFGAAGDFVTAPELSPLFGRSVARQPAENIASSQPHLLERGAGAAGPPARQLRDPGGERRPACAPAKYPARKAAATAGSRALAGYPAGKIQWRNHRQRSARRFARASGALAGRRAERARRGQWRYRICLAGTRYQRRNPAAGCATDHCAG